MGSASNLYVFREARTKVPGSALVTGLLSELGAIDEGSLPSALVRAGEIEGVVADEGSEQTPAAMAITDALADALVGTGPLPVSLRDRIASLVLPTTAHLSPPESFSYYGLHPLDYADVTQPLLPELSAGAAILGLRSIGTTLSAVVCAAIRARGLPAERRTVRPKGDPFDKATSLSIDERRWVAHHAAHGSMFLVADEGPGLSGSSFLSAGEALVAAGARAERIVFLCTRGVDPFTLRARDAARRWSAFRAAVVSGGAHVPPGATRPLPRDVGRLHGASDESIAWPPCWCTHKPFKRLSEDGRTVFSFEGLGRFGAGARSRASALADGGFGPEPLGAADGYIAYRFVDGAPARRALSLAWLDRLARYCAFRARACATDVSSHELHAMIEVNTQELFGVGLPRGFALDVVRPVVPDARMMPHEWLEGPDGRCWKTDGTFHGDDHGFPGPTDIAWDLAGAIVEWGMSPAASEALLERYRRLSGDRASTRVGPYIGAYALLRFAHARLAEMCAAADEVEAARFARDARRYETSALALISTTAHTM
jgi:hypothetical protein